MLLKTFLSVYQSIVSYLFTVVPNKLKNKTSVNEWEKVKQEERQTGVEPLSKTKILQTTKVSRDCHLTHNVKSIRVYTMGGVNLAFWLV